jgi:hypothetical protein
MLGLFLFLRTRLPGERIQWNTLLVELAAALLK